jgi:hypothetical protein
MIHRVPGRTLSGANLEKANLGNAHLEMAVLSEAHLEYASLAGAYLSRAFLEGTHLDGADLNGAHLTGVDLSRARGDASTRLPRWVARPAHWPEYHPADFVPTWKVVHVYYGPRWVHSALSGPAWVRSALAATSTRVAQYWRGKGRS